MRARGECQICHQQFPMKELYPASLIRPNVWKSIKAAKHPDLKEEGFICFPDLREINAQYFEDVLASERGRLTDLEREVTTSLEKHQILSENLNIEFDEQMSFGERVADRISQFGGSWKFIGIFSGVILVWMIINTIFLFDGAFDPYPYILLNLVLSCLAAIQAPVIMMSQNRQNSKDRLQMEHDYQVNLKSELQVRQLNSKLEIFMRHEWQRTQELFQMHKEIVDSLGDRPKN